MNSSDKELEAVGEFLVNIFKDIGNFAKGVFYGAKELKKGKSKIIILIILIALGIGLFLMKETVWSIIPKTDRFKPLKYLVYIAPLIPLIYLYSLGNQHDKSRKSFDDMFEKIGFYGKGVD